MEDNKHVPSVSASVSGGQEPVNVDVNLPRLNPPVMTASNIEFWFAASGLGNQHDSKKYNIVMAQVQPEKLTELRAIIDATPASEKYSYIKRKLIDYFADSQQKRLQQVLSDMPLGDMKPSQLYNEMTRVAGNSLGVPVLLDLWASRLPPHAQAAVIASKGDPSEKATIADAIVDAMGFRNVNSISNTASTVPANISETPASGSIEELQREIAQLTRRFDQMFRPQRSSRDRSRSRSQSRRSQHYNSESTYDMCWYHRTFGTDALRCRKPCTFGETAKTKQQWRHSYGSASAIGKPSDAATIFRLKIADTITNRSFLIDTGADVSVIPRNSALGRVKPTTLKLFAANGTQIQVYGEALLKVSLGLRREFLWTFLIADVTTGIIGADFICHYDLLIDLKRHRLIGNTTQAPTNEYSIKTFSSKSPYAELLAEFPSTRYGN
ncbi:uncharacterized protein LOC134208874 [Armigeres subalbatus]|uniref:uncharacterized protein LOC134208874 n=1 Tax=Armigeres subalbatus TaxID=124917 RepID=UPI002ED33608